MHVSIETMMIAAIVSNLYKSDFALLQYPTKKYDVQFVYGGSIQLIHVNIPNVEKTLH